MCSPETNHRHARINGSISSEPSLAAPCFAPYIQKLRRDRLILATPAELDNPNRSWSGSIEIVARESTELAGRGPASFALLFDEFAHVSATTSAIDADRLYAAATPALDQFRGYDFIYEGSSPSHQTGQFYRNYQRGLEIDPMTRRARNPDILVVQLPSWGPYLDWERAETIKTRPDDATTVGAAGSVPATFARIRRPIQVYDEQMRRREADDPAKFAVERRAQWAHVSDPYLNPALIDKMFGPHDGRVATFHDTGPLAGDYVAHGDPATRHDRFAWVIGHREGPDTRGLYHAWIDLIRYWAPTDFDDDEIDFLTLQEQFYDDIYGFLPYQVTFDQYSSVPIIQTLQQRVNRARLPKRVTFDQRPHTHTGNQELAEVFRTSLTLGLVHCPYDRVADEELRFLQERNGRVDHPDTGDVTTNDVAVSLMVVVRELIGYQNGFAVHDALRGTSLTGTNLNPDHEIHNQFRDFGRAIRQGHLTDPNPARGGHRRRRRH